MCGYACVLLAWCMLFAIREGNVLENSVCEENEIDGKAKQKVMHGSVEAAVY